MVPDTGPGAGDVRVRPVRDRGGVSDFIDVSHVVYRDDPAWIAPLRLERRQFLSPEKNPWFEHGRARRWVAYRAGEPVGRISAQVDELVRRRHGREIGHFGFLDAVDDAAVFQALFRAAEGWLRAEGVRRIRGPFSFSINQQSGLLVEGFEHPPMILMGHGRPHFQARVEGLGYAPIKDLLAYWIQADFPRPGLLDRLRRRYGERIGVRPLDGSRLEHEMAVLRKIFNDAWSGNWGFVPFTEAEFRQMGRELNLFVDETLVQIAELDGRAAAFIVCLPNLNEAIRDLDGRLLPFGWARLLWRLLGKRIRTARIPLMGVRREHQGTTLGATLALSVIDAVTDAGMKLGFEEGELSWILEDNEGMRSILESIEAEPYKRYRIYEKTLPADDGAES